MFKVKSALMRGLLGVIALCILTACLPVSAMAASQPTPEEYNKSVSDLAAQLEGKYGIRVEYPMGASYAGIGTATLNTLDRCLGYVTPQVVGALSDWCETETGSPLTVSFTYNSRYLSGGGAHAVAAYTEEEALIELLIPKANSTAPDTGATPVAIVHELGHVLHGFLQDRYSASGLSAQWRKLNGNAGYGGEYVRTAFVSAYAVNDYDEDFAETFAYGFVANRAGFSIARYLKAGDGVNTALGKKINYVGQLIGETIPSSEQALANLAQCKATPASINWNGLKLSGNSLEFIGYSAPFNVLKPLLRKLGIESKSSAWDKSVGGWDVTDASGTRYLVFPGGMYVKI